MGETESNPSAAGPRTSRHFVTTHWSLILAARGGGDAAVAALEEICKAYWPPLFVYARRGGLSPHDAQDAVQGFIANLLARNDLSAVLPERGRFRSFLLAAFKNFLVSRARGEVALKRGGNREHLSLDADVMEAHYARDLADESTPDRAYDRGWARAVMIRAFERLSREYRSPTQARLFAALRSVLADGGRVQGEAGLAAELGLTTGALAVAATRLRKRYRSLIEDEVRQTLDDPADLEGELRSLWQAWS